MEIYSSLKMTYYVFMNTNYLPIIKNLGLSDTQARVYLTLVEAGELSMTELAKKAELKRPTTYLAVEELEFLGIISKIKKAKRFVYSATHPRRLLNLINNRKKDFEGIFKQLEESFYTASERPQVQVFTGMTAMRDAYRTVFEKIANGEEGLFLGNIGSLLEKYEELSREYIQYLLSIERPRVREILFDTSDARMWASEVKKRSTSPTHQIRFIDKSFPFGKTDCLIVGDTVYMFSLGTELCVTIIKSEEITMTQKALFEWVWMQSE